MSRKAYKLKDIIKDTSRSFALTSGGETIISSADSIKYMKEAYTERLYLSDYNKAISLGENIEKASTSFQSTFLLWASSMQRGIDVMYKATMEEYDPLENYDRKEDGGYTDERHKGTRTENARKETTTPNTTTTTTETPRTTIEAKDFTYAFDSVAETPTNRTETRGVAGENITTNAITGTSMIEASAADNYTETRDISDTVFDKDVHVLNGYRVHGNIGVTKATDLIESEMSLRKNALAMVLLDEFINKWTFYCSGLEVIENAD